MSFDAENAVVVARIDDVKILLEKERPRNAIIVKKRNIFGAGCETELKTSKVGELNISGEDLDLGSRLFSPCLLDHCC